MLKLRRQTSDEKNVKICGQGLDECSVTRLGKNSQLWQNFKSLWQIFDTLFLIWQTVEPTLANLLHDWANFHFCKWPNIENNLTIWSHWMDGTDSFVVVVAATRRCSPNVMVR